MSRSQLKNSELRFYSVDGANETTKVKIAPTNNILALSGATAGTKITISNVAEPTEDHHTATKNYVDSQLQSKLAGLSWKEPVVCKTTANLVGSLSSNVFTLTANGALTIDGHTLALNDRVLVANQTTQSENGIYFCSTLGNARVGEEAQCVLTRTTDCDTGEEMNAASVFVSQGSSQADTAYTQISDNITLNTTSIVWQQFASTADLTGGDGISKVGNTLSADVDDTSIEISAGKIAIKTSGVTSDAIATNAVTNNEIQDATILVGQMADNAVETRVIRDANVTTDKLANESVTTGKLAGFCVDADKLANDAVTTIKILNSNVTETKLSNGSVSTDKIIDSAVTSAKVASGAIISDKLAQHAVVTDKILDGQVTPAKLAQNAVTTSKIANVNVTTEKLADYAVSTVKYANNSIDASKLKANCVETAKILDSAITETKLANNSVTTSKIGTLSSLVVSGTISATSFLASGGAGDAGGGFALPKSKSLSIDFNSTQAIAGDNSFVTIGGAVEGAGVNFTYDDNITMAIAFSVFRIQLTSSSGTNIVPNYEISYYDASQNQLAFNDVSGASNDFQLPPSASATDYQLSHQGVLGDGTTRIASIRLRLKQDQVGDTLVIKDSLQITALAVDNTSGNINKTYFNGSLS
jgi:hypothetical protein